MLRRRLRKLLYIVPGLAVLAALLLPAATAASANTPAYPWNVDTYDFGMSQGTHTFLFTNIYPVDIVDYPAPVKNPNVFHVVDDKCTAVVLPGRSCTVTVVYTPSGRPVADTLQLVFNDTSGKPVATPSVRMFGGGAEYLTTDYLGNIVNFPEISVWSQYVLWLIFHLHGVNPVDLPPDFQTPWKLVGNTCHDLKPGATSCQIGIAFQPTTAGFFSTSFQMPFTDPVSRLPVSVPVVTLQGTAR